MRLTFLGSDSKTGGCPSIYATDRGTYVVQGARVSDLEALADLRDVLENETVVEVPAWVFKYAPSHRRVSLRRLRTALRLRRRHAPAVEA